MTARPAQQEKPSRSHSGPPPKRLFVKGGLPPFKEALLFDLKIEPETPPFLSMKCVDQDLSYILVDPFGLWPDYAPQFSEADMAELEIKPEDAPLILTIVNVDHGTTNLVGPLLINPVTGKGKQVVIQNAMNYSARHKLLPE